MTIDEYNSSDEILSETDPISLTNQQRNSILQQHGQDLEDYVEDENFDCDHPHGSAQHLLCWLGY